jgi:DNA modification methylase
MLKKETIFAYEECRKNFNNTVRFLVPNVSFTKFKVKRVVNLFEDTASVRGLNYLAKISRSCFSPLWKN